MEEKVYELDEDTLNQTGQNAAVILRCFLNGSAPDHEYLKTVDFDRLWEFCRDQQISAFVGQMVRDYDMDHKWSDCVNNAVYRTVYYANEREKIVNHLEQNGIWYCLLKGCVLERYYPVYGLRQFTDNDILFDMSYSRQLRDYMVEQGYKVHSFGKEQCDDYRKEPILHFEMHHVLFETSEWKPLNDYYNGIEEKLLKKEGSMERYLSPDDQYIYLVAHGFKHYMLAGIGLRFLTDLFVFSSKEDLDWSYIDREMEKLQISDFEHKVRKLNETLFVRAELPEGEEKKMLQYMFVSGCFGNVKQLNEHKYAGNDSPGQYIRKRLFMTEESLKRAYPVVYRHRILYVGLLAYRLAMAATVKRKKVLKEIRELFQRYGNKNEE
ncbi:MAG: nucleotidyltransferase family protein [Erysipelotrichaceae bacterium]|nr:nucleotidyltransferase family protein [Erysipelotrichaceae bacterium]